MASCNTNFTQKIIYIRQFNLANTFMTWSVTNTCEKTNTDRQTDITKVRKRMQKRG